MLRPTRPRPIHACCLLHSRAVLCPPGVHRFTLNARLFATLSLSGASLCACASVLQPLRFLRAARRLGDRRRPATYVSFVFLQQKTLPNLCLWIHICLSMRFSICLRLSCLCIVHTHTNYILHCVRGCAVSCTPNTLPLPHTDTRHTPTYPL